MSVLKNIKHIYLNDLHFEQKMWLNEFKFFEDEIVTYEHRLEELVQKNNNKEMLAQLESYQNQFVLNKEVIDKFKHDIEIQNKQLAKFAEENQTAINHHYFDDPIEMRDKISTFKLNFKELKNNFFNYLSQWM